MAVKTSDYTKFKFLKGNRPVLKKHVTRLASSMALYPDLFESRPILVNDKFEIIDGQHRFTAAQQLGVPVYYEMAPGLKAVDAIALNRNQRNWGILDFIRSHANEGNETYVKVQEYLEEFKDINPSNVIAYLRLSGVKHGALSVLRDGKFEIVDEEASRKYLEQLQEIVAIMPTVNGRTPAAALLTIFKGENYDHDRMVRKMIQFGENQFNPYGNTSDILHSFENVYNFRQGEKNISRLY